MHQNSHAEGVFFLDFRSGRSGNAAFPQGADEGQVHAGRADDRGQDRQFRHHLCRRLHAPADLRRSPITPNMPMPMTLLRICSAASPTIFYFEDAAGNEIDPRQYIVGSNNFKKMSQELRIASPSDRAVPGHRRRFLPAPVQRHPAGISARQSGRRSFSVNGLPGNNWLTKQERIDSDYALFGEVSFDVTPQITLTGGGRYYKFNNTLFGFAGFGRNPDFIQGDGRAIRPAERGRQQPDRRRPMLHGQRRYAARISVERHGH